MKKPKDNRILIKNLNYKKSGKISGRVEMVESDRLFLSDISGQISLYFDKTIFKAKIGDIVEIYFIKVNKKFYITSCSILNTVKNDPVHQPLSPYYKLNKNNKRLYHTLINRQNFFSWVRQFFNEMNFLELHTPVLVESPGVESYIEPFQVDYIDYHDKKKEFFLPTSPEFSLKEALSGGLENIFEISRCFRNRGENSDLHNPDFFMLEWYRAYSPYEDIMKDVEKLLLYLCKKRFKKKYFIYQNKKCRLDSIKKVTFKELFSQLSINLDHYMDNEKKFMFDCIQLLEIETKQIEKISITKEDLFFKVLLNKIEPFLGWDQPVLLYEYPADMAALSEIVPDNPYYAKRFELYICGMEIANAFQELIDPDEQENRFNATLKFRDETNKMALRMPNRFLNALKFGLPPCSGIALGMERLFMIFEGLSSIKETNLVNMFIET